MALRRRNFLEELKTNLESGSTAEVVPRGTEEKFQMWLYVRVAGS
jgi:hypothetical protein